MYGISPAHAIHAYRQFSKHDSGGVPLCLVRFADCRWSKYGLSENRRISASLPCPQEIRPRGWRKRAWPAFCCLSFGAALCLPEQRFLAVQYQRVSRRRKNQRGRISFAAAFKEKRRWTLPQQTVRNQLQRPRLWRVLKSMLVRSTPSTNLPMPEGPRRSTGAQDIGLS